MTADLQQVIEQIGREKGIERDVLIDTVGAALLSAARKTLGAYDLRIEFDRGTGAFRLYKVQKVVEEVANPKMELTLEEALALNPEAQLGDEIKTEMPMPVQGFSRIAAQTAKQVIIQRVREAERDSVYNTFKGKEGELITGLVQRVVKGNVIVNVGKAEAILPPREQLPREDYRPGDRIRAYILDVKKVPKGSQIVLSRTHPGMLARLFELEVPEVAEGVVEIRAAAREPGERAKIAVLSRDPNVDPVGACVGYRGSRVQAVVRELQGERIDIMPWRERPADFIKSALQPAEVGTVYTNEEAHTLTVVVADEQLSLAIGKRGQNARLAAKLVGWKVDIKSRAELERERAAAAAYAAAEAAVPLTALAGVGEKMAERLAEAGFGTLTALREATLEQLTAVKGIGEKSAEKILQAAREYQVVLPQEPEPAAEAAPAAGEAPAETAAPVAEIAEEAGGTDEPEAPPQEILAEAAPVEVAPAGEGEGEAGGRPGG
ncbi:MAG: transcription termination factor NusA [Candidatus Methylomirabilales bacterium]